MPKRQDKKETKMSKITKQKGVKNERTNSLYR